jgi:hypothetical protein
MKTLDRLRDAIIDNVAMVNPGYSREDDDEFLMVYGVNHVATGKATWDLMYAFKVSRNCGNEPNCLPLALDD